MSTQRRRVTLALTLGAALLAALPLTAEEFYLKDGTKLVGKIVGFEKDAFRVETSFGMAIIYKDRILRIVFPDLPAKAAKSEETPKGAPKEPPKPAAQKPEPKLVEKETTPLTAKVTRPAKPAPPPIPPRPQKIDEYVTGTEYVNQTYRFRMFKPPTWRSYPQLVNPQNALVAALGTPDETTLLLVGHEYYNGNLADYVRLAERSVERLYVDYRPERERRTTVAGMPAIERSFTGEAEGRFWTGMALYFARGRQHYTLLALTAAGETTPFQQSVLRKVVGTMQFMPE